MNKLRQLIKPLIFTSLLLLYGANTTKKTNTLILYYEDFYAFGNLKENIEVINSRYKEETGNETYCEYVMFEEKIEVKNTKQTLKKEKSLDEKIHNEIKKYYDKNGPIDKLILGFHMTEDKIILPIIYSTNDENITMSRLTTEEMKVIAKNDPNSKKYFSENAQTIFYGCSSARGENSIAEEFSKVYNVKTAGSTMSYQGIITCDEKGKYELTSKTNQQSGIYSELIKSPRGTIYLKEENSNYLLDTLNDEVASFEQLMVDGEIKVVNDSLFDKGMDEFDVDLKLESCGFEMIENEMIDKYYTVREFNPNE